MAGMAVDSAVNLIRYAGNESDSTPYPIPFRFDATSWLVVQRYDADGTFTPMESGVDFEITGDASVLEAELTTTEAIPSSSQLVIARFAPPFQLLVLQPNAPLPPKDLERTLDQAIMALQDRIRTDGPPFAKAITFPLVEPADHSTQLPLPHERKDTVVYFNPINGEMEILRLDQLAQRLLVILGAEAVLPYRSREVSASLTVSQEDVNSTILVNTASDVTITLPETGDISPEFFCAFSRFGVGAVQFTASPGVVIESEVGSAPRIFGAKKPVGVQRIGENRWWVYGDIY